MTKEELFDAVGQISSETIERNAPAEKTAGVHKVIRWKRWQAMAASLAMLVIAGTSVFLYLRPGQTGSQKAADGMLIAPAAEEQADSWAYDTVAEETAVAAGDAAADMGESADDVAESESEVKASADAPAEANDLSGGAKQTAEAQAETAEETETEADDAYLLPDLQDGVEDDSRTASVEIGGYTAQYIGYDAFSEAMLQEIRGAELAGQTGWYRVSGQQDLRYLIHEADGRYTLWKFKCFVTEGCPKDITEVEIP